MRVHDLDSPQANGFANIPASWSAMCPDAPPGAQRGSTVQTSAALSKALCMLNRAGAEALDRKCRILLLQCCADVPGQYIACMNAIFSAQRLSVMIDGVSICTERSPFVEQVRLHHL